MGDECTRDYECPNQAACANKQCKMYGTLYNTLASDNELGCQSGLLAHVDSGIEGHVWPEAERVCFGAPELIPKSKEHPYRCDHPSDVCTYAGRLYKA